MNKITQFARKYPLSLICIALIWYLCIFFDVPKTPLNDVAFIDKWTHFVMYGGTCSVIWWEYLRCHREINPAKLVVWACIAPILMSGVVELAQANFTTNRQGDWLDFAANSVGVFLGNIIGILMYRFRK